MRKVLFALGFWALCAATGWFGAGALFGPPVEAQMRTPTPNVPLNDAMGQFWSLKTQDDGAGNQQPVVASATAATYSYATVVTPAASATDVWTDCGSSTKTISIESITVGATATAAAAQQVLFILRSTADTGGTSTAVGAAPNDSNDAAATATVLNYSANPSGLGTTVNDVLVYPAEATAAGTPGNTLTWTFRLPPAQPIVLRGANQCLVINLNGATASGLLLYVTAEQTEQ